MVILGPTASGKTHLAVQVAAQINGEVLSVDSRQVYRGMDIGTGKDLDEYTCGGVSIPHHLIDIVDAGERYNVSLFQRDFLHAYENVLARSRTAIACGGTGFYFHALLMAHAYTDIPVDEDFRERAIHMETEVLTETFRQYQTPYSNLADISTRKRLIRAIEISSYLQKEPDKAAAILAKGEMTYDPIVFGLNPPTDLRRERISQRLRVRLENGLVEEVRHLLQSGIAPEQLIYYGLEYKYVTEYVTGQLSFTELEKRLETEIHRFAKRQMTFFRKMEKDGIKINWLDYEKSEDAWVNEIIMRYNTFAVGTKNIKKTL